MMDSGSSSITLEDNNIPLVDLTVENDPFPPQPTGMKAMLPHMDTLTDFLKENPFFLYFDTLNVLGKGNSIYDVKMVYSL